MTRSIGGHLNIEALRQLHRPRTRDELRVAVHELRARGLGDYDIARATELSVEAVRRLLGEART